MVYPPQRVQGGSEKIYNANDPLVFPEENELFDYLFGTHNLTSDAEGEDMLTVSRKRVQEMYAHYDAICYDPQRPKDYIESVYEHADGVTMALDDLFGSKCLPDGAKDGAKGPNPGEPKFKVGQRMYIKYINKIGTIDIVHGYDEEEDGIYYHLKVEPKGVATVREGNLEPYTEPKEDIAEHRNLSQDCGNCPESVQKTDPDFGHLRLTIAAQMMQALVCAPVIPGVDPNPPAECLAQTAFRLADVLIAEAEK